MTCPLSNRDRRGKRGIAILALLVVLAGEAIAAEPVWLENEEIRESSGLAPSIRRAQTFWTHNDSGYGPRLLAFEVGGRHLGAVDVRNATAVDWEDMASYRLDGQPRLLVADVGDNARRREEVVLYEITEPELPGDSAAEVLRTWRVRYPDGPRDCEAVAVDVQRREILLIEKTFSLRAGVYAVAMEEQGRAPIVAQKIASVFIPLATAADVRADGSALVVLTYLDALVFSRSGGEQGARASWSTALSQAPRHVPLPPRRQGEAVCFDPQRQALWLTSEKLPTPLLRVELNEEGSRRTASGSPASDP